MANQEHLLILKRGVKFWNEWREAVWPMDLDPDLSGADLRGANLKGVDFRRTNLTKALLIGANLEKGDFRSADFRGANLHRAVLAFTDLWLGNFSGVNLSEAELRGAKLEINLTQANLAGANLSNARLDGAVLVEADLTNANLRGASLSTSKTFGMPPRYANLSGANLRGADLQGARLDEALLVIANLRGACLVDATLYGATLVQADLTNANLKGANLNSADLSRANLQRADLQGAKLKNTILWHTDLSGARLAGSELGEARFTKPSLGESVGDPFGDALPGGIAGYGKSPDPVDTPKEEREVPAVQPLHFTVYFPPELKPQQWQLLLAYAHAPAAINEVKLDSKKRLGLSSKEYQRSGKIGSTKVEKGTEIVVTPELAGCRFNPPRASFLWLEDSQCVEFKVQAERNLPGFEPGIATNGKLSFYVGPVLIAEVSFWACFSQDNEPIADPTYTEVTNDAYQAIFVSYSHQDTTIVNQLERAYRALGMQYLRDVSILRSGEAWNPQLLRKIDAADIFQLCWSGAAKASVYVEQEWRHALDLERSHFIRPVYWEQPLPEPPLELASLHFAFMELDEK
jgi:uncharacterized protein YjbI with pentapeptide repeats